MNAKIVFMLCAILVTCYVQPGHSASKRVTIVEMVIQEIINAIQQVLKLMDPFHLRHIDLRPVGIPVVVNNIQVRKFSDFETREVSFVWFKSLKIVINHPELEIDIGQWNATVNNLNAVGSGNLKLQDVTLTLDAKLNLSSGLESFKVGLRIKRYVITVDTSNTVLDKLLKQKLKEILDSLINNPKIDNAVSETLFAVLKPLVDKVISVIPQPLQLN